MGNYADIFDMKKIIACAAFMFIQSTLAMAANIYTTVPFENLPLVPNNVIAASYQFGNFSVIYCYENTFQFIGGMQWNYNGSTFSGTLSQISLVKPNPPAPFEGAVVDPAGTITITNTAQNNPGNTPLVVSCQFAY